MNKYKTLLSNTLLISIGTFGSKILVFFMVRFYTGYLTPSDYGTADLITQTANLLFPIISLGITDGVFRFALDNERGRRSVFTVGFVTITAGSVLFLAVIPVLNTVKEFKGYIWLIVVYTMASCYHSLCSQFIRAKGNTVLFSVQGIINTALVIGLNILFLAVMRIGVTGYVLSVVLADSLCTVFLFVKERLWHQFTLHPRKIAFKRMLRYSIPLIPATIFWWITSVSDRYMVNAMIGSAENGIYAVSYKIPTILTLVSSIFMQAWQFSAVTESHGDRREHVRFFTNVWRSFQAVMFLAGAVIIALAKPAIRILSTEEYYSAWQYVPLLSASMIFTAFVSFTGTVYVVTKQSGISFITAMAGAAINIALNLLLIPSPLGVQGAAIATFLSYFAVFLIRAVNSRKYIPFKLYGGHVAVNTVIILIQIVFSVLELPLWIPVQIICVLALMAVNYKFILACLYKLLSMVKK
ncbi:MAG: lipopolysaccharide biosynthesis protein [Acutalibacteraceae bacterium]